jgi:excisionase family DNA binding protein
LNRGENKMENVLISMKEFQECLGVGKNTAYGLLKSGEIPCFKIGKTWKIPRQGVLDYIKTKSYRQGIVMCN